MFWLCLSTHLEGKLKTDITVSVQVQLVLKLVVGTAIVLPLLGI